MRMTESLEAELHGIDVEINAIRPQLASLVERLSHLEAERTHIQIRLYDARGEKIVNERLV